jgi:5-methylcytosine-specific restriction endonuclease McrA
VGWREYDADHVIPHSKGGQTSVVNAQLLCRYHNQQKGANP